MTTKERQARGSRSNRGHLTEADVRAIKRALDYGATLATLAEQYRVSRGAIWFIKAGRRWKHVE